MKHKICVVGGGVVGLTCAEVLSEEFDVTLVADRIGTESASIIATAIWHVYLVDQNDRSTLCWAQETLERLMRIAVEYDEAGVTLVRGVELFRKNEAHLPSWSHIPPFFQLLSQDEISRFSAMDNPDVALRLPIRWGYRIEAPAATMDRYLPWLMERVLAKGVKHISRRLEHVEQALDYGVLIVNCSGYGARELTPEAGISPVKGQYVVYANQEGGPIEYIGDDDHPDETSYLISRSGEVIIGGTEEYGDDTENFTRSADELLDRIAPFEPWVRRLRGMTPLISRVGLRPFREKGVLLKLQRQPSGTPVIHNIGHGGSGFSLSWGCANEVRNLARRHFGLPVTEAVK